MALTTGTAAPAAAPRVRTALAAASCKGMTISECEGKVFVHRTVVHKRTTVKRKVTVKRKSTTYVHKTTKHTTTSKCRHNTFKRKKCKPKCHHSHRHNSNHSHGHERCLHLHHVWSQDGQWSRYDQQSNQDGDGQWGNQSGGYGRRNGQHSEWGQDN